MSDYRVKEVSAVPTPEQQKRFQAVGMKIVDALNETDLNSAEELYVLFRIAQTVTPPNIWRAAKGDWNKIYSGATLMAIARDQYDALQAEAKANGETLIEVIAHEPGDDTTVEAMKKLMDLASALARVPPDGKVN